MDHFHWSQYWKSIKYSLLKSHRFLSEEDLHYEKGKEDVLIDTLKRKFGASSSQINDLLFLHLICAQNNAHAELDEQYHEIGQGTSFSML